MFQLPQKTAQVSAPFIVHFTAGIHVPHRRHWATVAHNASTWCGIVEAGEEPFMDTWREKWAILVNSGHAPRETKEAMTETTAKGDQGGSGAPDSH